jgi:hypothetical protein
MCTPCMPNYYLCDFLEIIDNEKKESDGVDDGVYILHIKIYATRTYSGLER